MTRRDSIILGGGSMRVSVADGRVQLQCVSLWRKRSGKSCRPRWPRSNQFGPKPLAERLMSGTLWENQPDRSSRQAYKAKPLKSVGPVSANFQIYWPEIRGLFEFSTIWYGGNADYRRLFASISERPRT